MKKIKNKKLTEIISLLWNKYRNFILYSVIGVTGASLDYILFAIFLNVFNWNILVSNLTSVSAGIINNFILNTLFNFKTKDHIIRRFLSFYTIGLVGLGLSTIILKVFAENLGFNALIVKLASIVIVVIVQYILNRLISFREIK